MAKKTLGKYEGGTYRGGRDKKTPNLKKLDTGNLLNQHGVIFTPEEKRALENAVNTANRKRARMLKAAAELPRLHEGKPTGDTVAQLQAMGHESDFILKRKSKSIQRFTSHEQYENYMASLSRVNSREYIDDRINAYRANFTKTLENVYGAEAKDVVEKVRSMSTKDYMKMVESDESLEIGAVIPSDAKVPGRLNALRRALGMTEQDEFFEEEHNV